MVADFRQKIEEINSQFLTFGCIETIQINLGNMCNQNCVHCHVEASPSGNNVMSKDIIEKIIGFLKNRRELTLDITGGCPELNPNFKYFINEASNLTSRLMVRTNLTILEDNSLKWIPEWYKDNKVILIGSLPCYTEKNVNKQRGNGVFKKSMDAIKKLNQIGYGSTHELNLVYNPGGDFLPGPQKQLEEDYKKQLLKNHGVVFNNLFTITNAPLGRFRDYLENKGRLGSYIQMLSDNFNPQTAGKIMCRSLVNVDWQGILYDCDFNNAAGMPIKNRSGKVLGIDDISEAILDNREITMAEHCYSCTAGAGSSCTGVISN